MNDKETAYLNKLIDRFSNFKSPNETQKLIVALGNKTNRSDDENKKLNVLMKAEKKADELHEARQKARQLLQAEQTAERKKETRKKIIWGGALKTAAENNIQLEEVMQMLYDKGFISDRDRSAVQDDYDNLKIHQQPASQDGYE